MSVGEGKETVRRDAELAELDRLRAACVLSAGLAHEVANPLLGVITNLAEIERLYPRLRADMGPAYAERWESLVDCLDQARRSAGAIADVIRDFQAFLRPASSRIERFVEAGPLVERAIRMAGPQLKQAGCVRMQIEKTVPVKAPPSYITQIALNLLLNATEALSGLDPKRNRVEIRVTTEGPTVVLEVEDNGPGLDPAAAARVFEPHVTSKMSGTSLGLGLSICRAMVERLGGTISLRTTPGEGTCFRVVFPMSSPADAPATG